MIMLHVWPSNPIIIVPALWLALSASALKLKTRSNNQKGICMNGGEFKNCWFRIALFQFQLCVFLHTVTLQKSHTRFLTKTHKTQNINVTIKMQSRIKHEKSNLCTHKKSVLSAKRRKEVTDTSKVC
jgi:hypothetical protein